MIKMQVLNKMDSSPKNHRSTILALVVTALLLLQLGGCVENSLRKQHRPLPELNGGEWEAIKDVDNDETSVAEKKQTVPAVKPVIEIQTGNDNYLGKERVHDAKQIRVDDEGINLNFQGLDLQAFIQAVLGDALKQNYVIDPTVRGTVTIQTVRPLPEGDLLGVLQEVLTLNGATMVLNDGRYRIVPLNKAAQLPLVTRVKRLQNQGYGLQIVPLQFIGATEMTQILQPSMKTQGVVYTDKRRNLLILSGSEALITSMMDMINIFDVDWLAGKSISLFSLRYVEPAVLVKELEVALDGSGGELFDGVVRLIPIERVNGILVVSNTQKYLQELTTWIKRLDVSNNKVDKRLFVYHLKNTKAVDIAATLNSIFLASNTSETIRRDAQVLPTDSAVTIGGATGDPDGPGGLSGSGSAITSASISISEGSDINIIADEVSNTLVILGTAREYEMVESAIEKLDILPKQVLVEATILEVGLSGDLNFGVEWFFKNSSIGGNKSGLGQLSLGADGIAAQAPGFSYSVIDGVGDIRLVVNALESKTNVKVLSSPSIMVLDNKSATINIGDEIPVPTRQSTSNLDPSAPTVNEIQYRNTGILLEISPRINAGGLVTLEVKQEVSDAITTETSGLDAPTIQQRTIESTVAIQNGQSVILGGLIRDKQEDSKSGVPILSHLPVVGNLFSQTSNSDRRTELLVVLTPHVISNPIEAREITDEFREKLVRPTEKF
jgi:general secretion pathway protein D